METIIQKAKVKSQNLNLKVETKVDESPVVNEEKKRSWKDALGIFSQFVMIGGDLV